MKFYPLPVVLVASLSLHAWGALPYQVRHSLDELRIRHRDSEVAYQQYKAELSGDARDKSVERRVDVRLGEFRKCAERLSRSKPQALPETFTGTSMMWTSRARSAPTAVDSSAQFNCGPKKSVTPSTGEYGETDVDFAFSGRGGLSFEFVRRYASYGEFDCGLGKGWDHDFNAGVVFNADDVNEAQSCVLFWQGRDVNFSKRDGIWMPESGHFFSMEVVNNKVYLFTPLLMRIEFEPAVEKRKGVGRWRLSAVASRHDKWKANRIELEYLKDCDRIKSITGVRGERLDFAYDVGGHIVGINSQRKSVRYEYEADRLVRVRHSPVALSAQGGRDYCEPIVSYDYVTVGGGKKVCRKSLGGQSYCLEISYDDQGRVIRCGYVSKDAKQMWQLTYKPNETIVESPKPSADVHYFWGGTPHPSLPCRLEIPAQKTVVRYVFNADYLLTEEVDALGVKTVQEYDSDNPNTLMRGNLLSERRLAGTGVPIKWCEFGVRTSYEKEIALPIKIESYQLETNGVEEIVKREMFKYRPSDYSLCEKRETGGAENGGVLMRYVCNRYGEVGLERDAKNNVTIYEYAESLPKRVDFDFMQGSPSNGGLLVRKIEDANAGQKNNACRVLNTSVIRNEIVRVKPCAMETLYAWDCDGNLIREKRGFHEKLSLFNEKGATLALFNNGVGLSLTEYHPDGRAKRVLGEFCPGQYGYRGQSTFFFEGCFSETSFEYDSLGQMSARSKTDERIDGVEVKDTFVRHPNGKIARIINPSGVTREDSYDLETGFIVSQVVKGKTEDIPLGRIIERFPGGSVRVYEDKLGAVWTNRLDAFGHLYETVSSLGTTKREVKDSLGRIVEVCEFDATKIYSHNVNVYSRDNGYIESERKWKSNDGKSGEWIEVAHHLYDETGNEAESRGVHKDSWSYSLFDGLGRKVATSDPVDGYSIVVYDADCEAYTHACSIAQKDKKEFKQGNLRILDGVGRVVETIPVDSEGKLVRERHTINAYNLIGQVVRTESMGLSSKESEYNSLGWVVKETTSPLNAKQGESPIVVSTGFRADGKTIARELGNNALALFGDKDNVRPELVDAPQITRYYYDEYGRLQKTENPDGLIVTTRFNRNSLPSQMTWTHASSTNILRQIEFFYSPLGQVQKLVDGMTKNTLQEFSYDGAGMLTKAVDWNGGEQVVLKSKYDTCGQKIENQTILSGHAFPARRFDYDPVKGIAQAEWIEAMSGAFWRKETMRTDAAGRLRAIMLDEERSSAVEWEYMGRLPRSRRVKDSAIDTEYTYTSLGELSDVRMFDSFTHDEVGCLGYAYGQQGQMLFSSALLKAVDNAGDYQFTAYSHFDDFRRLTGQNAESVISDKNDWQAEWQRVFGISERSLANQDTMRMRYDQANNIWVKYQGEEFKENAAEFTKDQSPIFTSSAKPFPTGGSADKRELASNREVSKASFDKEGGRSAEVREYDLLGNLIEYKGYYWNGTYKIPVKWSLEYDTLGRLMRMEAKSDDDSEYPIVEKGEVAGALNFAYDAQNRRIMKRVINQRPTDEISTNVTFTVYKGTHQALVYEKDGDELKLIEEYLWGVGTRELILAAMTKVEKNSSSWPIRYAFQQDSGFNTVLVTKNDSGRRIPVSVSSYLGFGENATRARIKDIKSSMGSRNKEDAYNNQKDDKLLTATWLPGKSEQFIELKMHDARKLSLMTIWGASGLPHDFLVYVLPEGVDSPDEDGFDLDKWHFKNQDYLSSVVRDGYCQGYQKQDSYYSPYKVALGDRRGDRIVIAWRQELDSIKIKEIEVVCTPDNPSAIAFAGQWLDRETGLYYQINRYRIAGSDKFISPDPLGFAAGDNLYAYANGNPLEWHDPDGRSPTLLLQVGIGAAIGAIIGGGGYALRCWWTGEEFSWTEFAIQTFIGAASGAIAGLTMGLFNPWAGQVSANIAQAAWHGAARGAVAGLASGAFTGAADPVIHGVINGDDAWDITENAMKGAGIGALSGATIGAALGAASGAYAQWNLQRPGPGAVWRVCRPDENPGKGLFPKDPTATKTLNSHIGSGSRSGYQSQYISTTKDYATAYKWAQKTPGARIVKIDTSKLSNKFYDFTDPAVREKHLSGRWSNNFAKGAQEVVIEGPVKSEAITEAKFLGFDF